MHATLLHPDRTRSVFARLAILGEAALILCLSRVALSVLPFQVICRRLGVLHAPCAAETADVSTCTRSAAIGSVIARVAGRLPFRSNCLTRALAAWAMLHRRRLPCKVHFGVMPAELAGSPAGRPTSHAWVTSGDLRITGYPEALLCTELGYFARERPTDLN